MEFRNKGVYEYFRIKMKERKEGVELKNIELEDEDGDN